MDENTNITITDIYARQILDSRGNPTVEADVVLSDGSSARLLAEEQVPIILNKLRLKWRKE